MNNSGFSYKMGSAYGAQSQASFGNKLNLNELKKFLPHNVFEWTPFNVGTFLKSVGLSTYAKLFEEYPIAGFYLNELTEQDLEHMNIKNPVHKRMLLKAFKSLEDYDKIDDDRAVNKSNISYKSTWSNAHISFRKNLNVK